MALGFKDRWAVCATPVANEFIDEYMASANGEYVKVYLFLLRHWGENITIELVADALCCTEGDVRRAITYWEKAGVLAGMEEEPSLSAGRRESAACMAKRPEPIPCETREEDAFGLHGNKTPIRAGEPAGRPALEDRGRAEYSADQMNRLAEDEEFAQLLYIAQKYLNKIFTSRECQVFAYLYDQLRMKPELLEFLVEYCAQNGHTSIRYLETVALNWHENGLDTVEKAKAFTSSYNRDAYAVMKAFGLTDRKPGEAEKRTMDRWFKDYGFSRAMVTEACNRTMQATHNPSFRYADKILSEWYKAGVRTMGDVDILDQKRQQEFGRGQAGGKGSASGAMGPKRTSNNQFHNFNQRNTDYDALVLQQVKDRMKEPQ